MRIGIDCRMYGPRHTGSGRYIKNLVKRLVLNQGNQYFLFASKKEAREIKKDCQLTERVKVVGVDIAHYSLKEQLLLPVYLYCQKLDLVHFPQFNVPILYFGRFVVTIHDLIKHSSKGPETTTRSPWIYWLKYLAYRLVFGWTVKRAAKIIVPSHFVKNELTKVYGLSADKVVVTYEGVDDKLSVKKAKQKVSPQEVLEKYQIKKPYLLYVGNVYPHKNVKRLIEATKLLASRQSPITLVIVCARSVFWERLKNEVERLGAGNLVNLVGFVSDQELAALYWQAQAFVFPTLAEGFGLPGLEAMAQGVPVAASDIPVLREIYKGAACFFDPNDTGDMAKKIKELLVDNKLKMKLIRRGKALVGEYSWDKMAKETLEVYGQALR